MGFLVNRTTTSSSRLSQIHMGPKLHDYQTTTDSSSVHRLVDFSVTASLKANTLWAATRTGAAVGPTMRRTFIICLWGRKGERAGVQRLQHGELDGHAIGAEVVAHGQASVPRTGLVQPAVRFQTLHALFAALQLGQMTPVHTEISLFPLVQPAAYLPQRSQQSTRPRQRFTTHQPTTSVSGQGLQRSCRGFCPRLKAI